MVESALTRPPLACRSSRDEQRRYGLDLTGGKGRLAGCSLAGGQGIVDCLTEIDLEQREPNDIEPTGELHFSIPENETIIKRVKIPADRTFDDHKLALFEFQSSLLSQADQYYLETYSLDGKPERLAVAYNRALVDQKLSFLTAKIRKPTGFRLRSLALLILVSGLILCLI
ncbi:MAG: hypothetical protein NTV06_01285 [candidate division Zixibacteria bacterium]|nr:hypothetical protein [candidate division Zixibacteria bacterium]